MFSYLTRTLFLDVRRLKTRAFSAAICYAVAAVMFLLAVLLAGGAGVIVLVDRWGVVAGLLMSSGVVLFVGVAAIAVNALLRWRYRRLRRYAAMARSSVVASAATAGLASGRSATPFLLPIVGLAAFALANSLMNGGKDEDEEAGS